jgi:formate dehydrogenase subunit gamma
VSEKLQGALGVKMGESTSEVTLEPVYCLGLCGNGPAALENGRPYADLGGRGFDRLMEAVRR